MRRERKKTFYWILKNPRNKEYEPSELSRFLLPENVSAQCTTAVIVCGFRFIFSAHFHFKFIIIWFRISACTCALFAKTYENETSAFPRTFLSRRAPSNRIQHNHTRKELDIFTNECNSWIQLPFLQNISCWLLNKKNVRAHMRLQNNIHVFEEIDRREKKTTRSKFSKIKCNEQVIYGDLVHCANLPDKRIGYISFNK